MVEGFGGLNDTRSDVNLVKLVLGEGPDKTRFQDLYDVEQKQGLVYPAQRDTRNLPWSWAWMRCGQAFVHGVWSVSAQ